MRTRVVPDDPEYNSFDMVFIVALYGILLGLILELTMRILQTTFTRDLHWTRKEAAAVTLVLQLAIAIVIVYLAMRWFPGPMSSNAGELFHDLFFTVQPSIFFNLIHLLPIDTSIFKQFYPTYT